MYYIDIYVRLCFYMLCSTENDQMFNILGVLCLMFMFELPAAICTAVSAANVLKSGQMCRKRAQVLKCGDEMDQCAAKFGKVGESSQKMVKSGP